MPETAASRRPLSVAAFAHAGNSVLVRGGLEVHFDSLVSALRRRGVTVVSELGSPRANPQVALLMGAYYGMTGVTEVMNIPTVVLPILLRSDQELHWWRVPADYLRSILPGSLHYERRRILRRAATVVVNSSQEARAAKLAGARKVVSIPAGIDISRFSSSTPGLSEPESGYRAELVAWLECERRVLSVARFERRKNQHEVVEACQRVGAGLLLLGRPSPTELGYLATLRDMASSPAIQILEDPPDDVVTWAYQQAHVHVLASRHETAGLVSLEAAACGARPVAIDQPTSREYLGGIGVLAGSTEPQEIARAIHAGLARGRLNEVERSSLRDYDWAVIAARTEEVLRSVLPL